MNFFFNFIYYGKVDFKVLKNSTAVTFILSSKFKIHSEFDFCHYSILGLYSYIILLYNVRKYFLNYLTVKKINYYLIVF